MGSYWDPNKVSSPFELRNSNVRAYCTSSDTDQSAIGEAAASGKVYFEVHPVSLGSYSIFGICTDTHTSSGRTGYNDESWGWMENGRLYHDGSYDSTTSFSDTDILQCAIDLDNNKVWFGKNNTWIESGDPANGTNPCFDDAGITGDIFACFSMRYADDAVDLKTLSSEFTYSPPTGFSSLATLYEIAGTVYEGSVPIAGTVRVYNQETGELLGETVSEDSDGSFSLDISYAGLIYVVAFDRVLEDSDSSSGVVADYNALIYSGISPEDADSSGAV